MEDSWASCLGDGQTTLEVFPTLSRIYSAFPGEVFPPLRRHLEQVAEDQLAMERANSLFRCFRGDREWIDSFFNGINPSDVYERLVVEYFRDFWVSDFLPPLAREHSPRRLSPGGLTVELCHPRLIAGDPSIWGDSPGEKLTYIAGSISERFGDDVGLALSPISEPQTSAYAPYSPSSRTWLDCTYCTDLSPLPQEHFRNYLEVVGARGLLNAWFEVGRERLILKSPLDAIHSLGIESHEFSEVVRLLVEQCRTFEFWRAIGRTVPIVHDLPVSFRTSGFEAWFFQDVTIPLVEFGAPPDALARDGQRWGLSVMEPTLDADHDFPSSWYPLRLFSELGYAVRFDHAISLRRRYVVPVKSALGQAGAFVELEDDRGFDVVANRSRLFGLELVAEDLGDVPIGLRDDLAGRDILGMVVPLFEDLDPRSLWKKKVVSVSTFDLPTVTGLLSGQDREELGTLGRFEEVEEQSKLLGNLLDFAGLGGSFNNAPGAGMKVTAVLRGCYIKARARGARCVWVPFEDLLGISDRPNVPGTSEPERTNWLRPLREDDSYLGELSIILGESGA